ncbi:hypothetical protein [Aeromicrobium sp. UC242_57]|uniref:hypothetical protein n=1 Tax=Aeromicrobium sp. UC242_57 TaxID=3374624 RepID=UPI0037BB7AE6
MLLGGGEVDDSTWPGLPDFATYAIDVVDGPDALQGALRRLLFKVAVVDTLPQARGRAPGVRRHGGHARRRCAGRAFCGGRLDVQAEPHRGAGCDRAGRRRPRRRGAHPRTAEVRA